MAFTPIADDAILGTVLLPKKLQSVSVDIGVVLCCREFYTLQDLKIEQNFKTSIYSQNV